MKDTIQTDSVVDHKQSDTYTPKIDDYVRWQGDEGWVYFVCPDYFTIEVLAKCKDEEDIQYCPIHKKIHVLVVCYRQFWKDVEYLSNRRVSEVTSGADAESISAVENKCHEHKCHKSVDNLYKPREIAAEIDLKSS